MWLWVKTNDAIFKVGAPPIWNLLKSLRDPPTPPLLINWDVPDAEDAGNARDATTKHKETYPIFASKF